MNHYDIVKRIRTAFDDTEEVASWCDDETYEGEEMRTHLLGLHEAALEACDEVERLRRENSILRQELKFSLVDEIMNMYDVTEEEADTQAEQQITWLVAHNEGAE